MIWRFVPMVLFAISLILFGLAMSLLYGRKACA
jgi:hypothetical protein